MTDELAKELKDAGYPNIQMSCGDIICNGCPHGVPTLSELIEACLPLCYERFCLEEARRDIEIEKRWFATDARYREPDRYIYVLIGNGSSPEEAVANLWIELNKRK